MILSILIGYCVGKAILKLIELIINAYQYLTSYQAKEKVQGKLGKDIGKIMVDTVRSTPHVNGELINAKVYDSDYNHIANVTYIAAQGSSLYSGQVIY